MSFVLSEININEEAWFGMGGCSLITSVCVLVFAEEDAGKAGRVRASEQNTNETAYLCSVPALTLLWSFHMQPSALEEQERRLLAVDTLESHSCPFIEHINSSGFAITCTGIITFSGANTTVIKLFNSSAMLLE